MQVNSASVKMLISPEEITRRQTNRQVGVPSTFYNSVF